jgi:hypothetical protein
VRTSLIKVGSDEPYKRCWPLSYAKSTIVFFVHPPGATLGIHRNDGQHTPRSAAMSRIPYRAPSRNDPFGSDHARLNANDAN